MKPIYIFDLDGTLADAQHRVRFIKGEKKDWRAFFAACVHDAPIARVLRTMRLLRAGGAECWIWTGRSAEVLTDTRRWLTKFDAVPNDLRMRAVDDHRADHIIKREWLMAVPPELRSYIVGVFEDRDSVVKMWRDAGLQCFQVAPGDF